MVSFAQMEQDSQPGQGSEHPYAVEIRVGPGKKWWPIQIERTVFESSVREGQLVARENLMKSNNNIQAEASPLSDDELRPEYDLSQLQGGVRGKYAQRYKQGTNLVLLDPDVADAFPTEDSVNEALRLLMRIAETQLAHRVQT